MIQHSFPSFSLRKEDFILQLQNQIYYAEMRGNIALVRKLQTILLNHPFLMFQTFEELLSKNSNIEDFSKNLSTKIKNKSEKKPEKKLNMIQNLKVNFKLGKKIEYKSSKTKIFKIVKNNKPINTKLINTPLKTKFEILLQKKICEPTWESRFSTVSYGGRTNRSSYDAIMQIQSILAKNSYYFFQVQFNLNSISFPLDLMTTDSIPVQKKDQCFKFFKFLFEQFKVFNPNKISQFLNLNLRNPCFFMDLQKHKKEIFQILNYLNRDKNISNLNSIELFYLNILFHFFESEVENLIILRSQKFFFESIFKSDIENNLSLFKNMQNIFQDEPSFLCYNNQFVFFHSNQRILEKISFHLMRLVESFNYLKIEQTEIGHTLLPIMNRPPGLNFLNFAISQKYEISHPNLVKKNFNSSSFFRKQSVDKLHGFHTFSTIINPSSLAIKTHMNELKEIVKTFSSQTQENLIYKLTPKIRHWSNYFKIITTKKNYFLCDFFLLKLLWRWACRRHPKKVVSGFIKNIFITFKKKNGNLLFLKKRTILLFVYRNILKLY